MFFERFSTIFPPLFFLYLKGAGIRAANFQALHSLLRGHLFVGCESKIFGCVRGKERKGESNQVTRDEMRIQTPPRGKHSYRRRSRAASMSSLEC